MKVPGATAHPLSRRAFFMRLSGRFSRKRLVQRLRHEADSKNRPPGLVQEFHFPLGVLFELAGNAADDVGTNAGQLAPRRIAISKLHAGIGSTGVATISNAKEKERHGMSPMRKDRSGLMRPHKICRQLTPYPGIDQHRVITELGWEQTRRLSGYSLSVIRIRPSPVTMGPLAVTMT